MPSPLGNAASRTGEERVQLGAERAWAALRAVEQLADQAIVACDTHCRIVSWNPAAARLFGRSDEEALGESFEQLFDEQLHAELVALMAQVRGGDVVHHVELEARRSDGLSVPISMSLGPIPAGHGLPPATIAVISDVTEQVLAQSSLAEMTARLQEGEALAHVGTWMWDHATGTVQWSAEFHRIHGIDPLAFGGTVDSHLEAIVLEDRERVWAAMEHALASATPLEIEYRVRLHDGEERRVLVLASPTIGTHGSAIGLRGTGRLAATR